MEKTSYKILGGMSGSSMDGLDLVLATFWRESQGWRFAIDQCETIDFPAYLYQNLQKAPSLSLAHQNNLDRNFGLWIANEITIFSRKCTPDLLAIHGHTVEHAPEKGISKQLGCGQTIADCTKIRTVTEFRTADVKIGGQGAPLVPVGDFELFNAYDACLNLGGIANISIRNLKLAGDICPCNQVLNHYAGQLGMKYDDKGSTARKGKVDEGMMVKLRKIPFFETTFPKSLPNHFISQEILNSVTPLDGLRTYTEFIAKNIAKMLPHASDKKKRLLISGGGAYNDFLIELLRMEVANWEIYLPPKEIIEFKEALIFAFLGLKKIRGEVNVLKSVTGGKYDTSSGTIHLPKG